MVIYNILPRVLPLCSGVPFSLESKLSQLFLSLLLVSTNEPFNEHNVCYLVCLQCGKSHNIVMYPGNIRNQWNVTATGDPLPKPLMTSSLPSFR